MGGLRKLEQDECSGDGGAGYGGGAFRRCVLIAVGSLALSACGLNRTHVCNIEIAGGTAALRHLNFMYNGALGDTSPALLQHEVRWGGMRSRARLDTLYTDGTTFYQLWTTAGG